MENVERHLSCNGFEAWVRVEEKVLPQYDEKLDKRKKLATCWIPSEADKAFSIHFQHVTEDQDDFKCKVFIDGNRVDDPECWVLTGDEKYLQHKVSSAKAPGRVIRSLTFGSTELTDDDDPSPSAGEIKIVVHSVKMKRRPYMVMEMDEDDSSQFLLPIQPAKAHQIKCGEIVGPRIRDLYTIYTTQEHRIVATFIFRYRPLALLQVNGIAPFTPPAYAYYNLKAKADSKDEVNDDEDDEKRAEALLERERALIAELAQVRLAKRALARPKDQRPKKKLKSSTVVPGGKVIELII